MEEVKDFKCDAAPDKQVKCKNTQMVSTQKGLFNSINTGVQILSWKTTNQ